MIIHLLQILLLLGITILLAWLYFKIRLLGMERDKKSLNDNFSDLRIKYSSLLTRYAKIEDDMIKTKGDAVEHAKQRSTIEAQLQDLLLVQETYKNSISHLETYKKRYDEQINKWQTARIEVDALNAQLKRLEREKINAQTELERRQATIDQQTQRLNELITAQTAHRQLQHEHNQAAAEIAALSNQVNRLNAEKQQLTERTKNDALQITALQATLLSLETIKERYNQLLPLSEQYKTKANTLTQELADARRTIAQLENKVGEHETQATIQQHTHKVLNEIRTQYQVLMPQYQKLETELRDLQDKISQLAGAIPLSEFAIH